MQINITLSPNFHVNNNFFVVEQRSKQLLEFRHLTISWSLGINKVIVTLRLSCSCLLKWIIKKFLSRNENVSFCNHAGTDIFVRFFWSRYSETVITNSVVTIRFLGLIGHFTTQTNRVKTNPDYNKQKRPVPSCSL